MTTRTRWATATVATLVVVLLAGVYVRRGRHAREESPSGSRNHAPPAGAAVAATAAHGITIHGSALDASSQPCADAVVALVPESAEPLLQRVGRDGAFRIETASAGTSVYVVASSSHCGVAQVGPLDLVDGDDRDVHLILEKPGATLRGTVVDAGGGGVEAVLAVQSVEGTPRRAVTVSGADGHFEVGLPPGAYMILATADGYLDGRSIVDVIPPARDMTIALMPAGRIRGLVIDGPGGAPVGGGEAFLDARVHAAPVDGEGHFMVAGVGAGRHTIVVRSGERVGETTVDVGPGGEADVVVELQRTHDLPGRVMDADGRGIAGATVRCADEQGRDGRDGTATTGADGAFTVGTLLEGSYVCEAEAVGFARRRSSAVVVASDTRPIAITLVSGGSIEGIVRGPDGAPAPGAAVRVRLRCAGGGGEEQSTRTSDVGAFRFDHLCEGRAQVTGTIGSAAGAIDVVVADDRVTQADLRLLAAGSISGRVVSADGAPASVLVSAYMRASGRHLLARSDATGAFTFEGLAPGDVSIKASSDGAFFAGDPRDASEARVQLGPGEHRTGLELRVPSADGITRGTVRAGGQAVVGALVVVSAPGLLRETYSLDDGSFEVGSLPRGLVTLTVRAAGHATAQRSVPADGAPVDVELERVGAVRVRITSQRVLDFHVQVAPLAPSGTAQSIVSRAGHEATIEGVAPGHYRVLATSSDGESAYDADIVVTPGKETLVELTSAPPGSLRGRVVDAAGSPSPRTSVLIMGLPQLRIETTGADGVFTAQGVPAGVPLRLYVRSASGQRAEVPVTATSGAMVDVLVTLH